MERPWASLHLFCGTGAYDGGPAPGDLVAAVPDRAEDAGRGRSREEREPYGPQDSGDAIAGQCRGAGHEGAMIEAGSRVAIQAPGKPASMDIRWASTLLTQRLASRPATSIR